MTATGKVRLCPALGRNITSAECGQSRNSQIACTADCQFNPFAPCNYDVLLDLEQELDEKRLTWLVRERPGLLPAIRKLLDQKGTSFSSALITLLTQAFVIERNENSTTSAQRMERSLGQSVRNDLRVLLQARMRTEIRLIEVHRVLDEQLTEAIDLLSSRREPFLILDRTLARGALRFTTLLSWTYPLPHFTRLGGAAQLIPPFFEEFDPDEVVREIAVHMGGPAHGEELRRWLAAHYTEFTGALKNASRARFRLMIELMDAKFGSATYELVKPYSECRETLDKVPEVMPEDLTSEEHRESFAEARVWFLPQEQSPDANQSADLTPVLGRVLMGPGYWRVEAISSAKLKNLRQRFEREMGSRVRFVTEQIRDLANSLLDRVPPGDLSKVPPRLLENPGQIALSSSRAKAPLDEMQQKEATAQFLHEHDRRWIDQPTDAFGGLTPRQAAHDDNWRPTLVRLMKHLVLACDEKNKADGTNRDINWMLVELGLDEINFDPPPLRRTPAQ